MPTRGELSKLSRVRLRDAEVLYRHGRFASAYYICGYAVEFALKARICATLGWANYQVGSDYSSFRTHKL